LIFALEQALPAIPGPAVRDFGDFLSTDRTTWTSREIFRPLWWTSSPSLTRRGGSKSAWMGIIVHSAQSVTVVIVVLTLVLG
jgi:hypothetical protein